jgi:AcrR family transcriptional regulator
VTTRRAQRHQAVRREILDAAWELARSRGLTGWSLRDLATAVGMQPPSLYVYFDRKDAIYDALFADGMSQMLDGMNEWLAQDLTPIDRLRDAAHRFFDFAVTDPARMQLLFQRIIPGFEPSEASYAAATDVMATFTAVLRDAGITDPRAADLWTALLTGLANQQVSNDPGGKRWSGLVDEAVDMFLAHWYAPAAAEQR